MPSSSVKKVTAEPALPALPVRPVFEKQYIIAKHAAHDLVLHHLCTYSVDVADSCRRKVIVDDHVYPLEVDAPAH